MPRPERRVYAHRGASRALPENTLPAFARALATGVDAIETDAHLTRDGVVVLHHDASARRMAGVDARWRDIDLATAQGFNVGASFRDAAGQPLAQAFVVPTLREALEAFPAPRFNIDLKQHDAAMVAAVLATVRAARAEHRVTLASFDWRTLRAVRRAGFAGETALASAEVVLAKLLPRALWRRLPYLATAAQIPRRHGPLPIATPAFIAKCHALGMRVDIWTVNDAAEAADLFALGVDGIMTDVPETLMPALRGAQAGHRPSEGAG